MDVTLRISKKGLQDCMIIPIHETRYNCMDNRYYTMHCDVCLISPCTTSAMQVLFEFYFGISSLGLCILTDLGEHKRITEDFPVQGSEDLSLKDRSDFSRSLFHKAAKMLL